VIEYTKGYKYCLASFYTCELKHTTGHYRGRFYTLDGSTLTISAGYAWDGASFAFDGHMKTGSLVHDVLYQMMRQRQLKVTQRENADKDLIDICRQNGMTKLRAKWVYTGVRLFGKGAATNPRKVYKE